MEISLQCPQLFTVFLDVSSPSHKKNRRKLGRKYVKVFCFSPLPPYLSTLAVFGLGGLVVMDSLASNPHTCGEPGREITVGGMSFTRSLKVRLVHRGWGDVVHQVLKGTVGLPWGRGGGCRSPGP